MNVRRHIFEFITDHITRWNYQPTRAEICKFFAGMSEDVNLHLEQLEREGLLIFLTDSGDTVTIPPTFRTVPQLKLCSSRTTGEKPFCGNGANGRVALDLQGVGIPMEPNMFALRVLDGSMVDAGIQRGDIAILKHASPQRGDIVAVELEGQMLLRRYVIIAGLPHVLAENPLRPDLLFAHDLPMHGVYWGLIRTEPCRVIPDHVHQRRVTYSTPADGGSVSTVVPSRTRRVAPVPSPSKRSRNGEAHLSKKARAKREVGSSLGIVGTSCPGEWPKPPTGIELNDMASLEYKAVAHTLVEDKPEYGWALRQAIKNYEEREKPQRECG